MSTNEFEQTVVPIESDMPDLLRAKRARPSDGSRETGNDYSCRGSHWPSLPE